MRKSTGNPLDQFIDDAFASRQELADIVAEEFKLPADRRFASTEHDWSDPAARPGFDPDEATAYSHKRAVAKYLYLRGLFLGWYEEDAGETSFVRAFRGNTFEKTAASLHACVDAVRAGNAPTALGDDLRHVLAWPKVVWYCDYHVDDPSDEDGDPGVYGNPARRDRPLPTPERDVVMDAQRTLLELITCAARASEPLDPKAHSGFVDALVAHGPLPDDESLMLHTKPDYEKVLPLLEKALVRLRTVVDLRADTSASVAQKPAPSEPVKLSKWEFMTSNGVGGKLSKYARKIIDLEKSNHFQNDQIHFKNSDIVLTVSAKEAWELALKPLLTESTKLDGEEGWVKLTGKWRQKFPAKDVYVKKYIHPHIKPKEGKKSAGKRGDGYYRLEPVTRKTPAKQK